MSEANRVALRFNATESDGTPITPAGDAVALAFSGETLQQDTDTVNSELIREDRQIADHVRTNIAASGDINFELLYAAFDQMFEAALQSVAWSTPHADITNTVTETVAPNLIRSTNTGEYAAVTVGSIVRTNGFATSANNGYARVAAVGDFNYGGGEVNNELTLEKLTLTTEAAGASVTLEFSSFITNGTRQQKFTIEREYTDLATDFALFTGMIIDQMNLDVSAEAIITGSFSFVGSLEDSTTTTIVSGSETPVPSNPVYNAVDNVPRIVEGASNEIGTDECVTAINFSLNNNSRARNCVGKLGPDSYGSGTIDLTGTFSVYYTGPTLADKHLDYVTTSLFMVLADANGNAYIVELPQVKITSSARNAGSTNTDIIVDYNFAAFRDDTEGWTIRMHRLA